MLQNWPTWTTKGNDRWLEHVTRKDKVMPYGELSYLISGKLEIVPKDTGVPVVVNPGDFVTFPEGFVSDWTVLEGARVALLSTDRVCSLEPPRARWVPWHRNVPLLQPQVHMRITWRV